MTPPTRTRAGARKAATVKEVDPIEVRLAALDDLRQRHQADAEAAWSAYQEASHAAGGDYQGQILALASAYQAAVERVRKEPS